MWCFISVIDEAEDETRVQLSKEKGSKESSFSFRRSGILTLIDGSYLSISSQGGLLITHVLIPCFLSCDPSHVIVISFVKESVFVILTKTCLSRRRVSEMLLFFQGAHIKDRGPHRYRLRDYVIPGSLLVQ